MKTNRGTIKVNCEGIKTTLVPGKLYKYQEQSEVIKYQYKKGHWFYFHRVDISGSFYSLPHERMFMNLMCVLRVNELKDTKPLSELMQLKYGGR